jgi:LysM repeat protein
MMVPSTLLAMEGDSLRSERKDGITYVWHQVDQGETLYSLSRRYKSDHKEIAKLNNVINNEIEIGQVLQIPYGPLADSGPDNTSPEVDNPTFKTHTVKAGETLFSLSKAYGVSLDELKNWNNLADASISIGQELIVSKGTQSETRTSDVRPADLKVDPEEPEEDKGYRYVVRNGDNLRSIARKFETSVDSIKKWNNLYSNNIQLGQELYLQVDVPVANEININEVARYRSTTYGSKIRTWQDGGVTKVIEEGAAKKIEGDLDTENYLALHRNLRIGTVLQVKNLMNNQKIYVRIVGKLPDTGINDNVMIRLTPVAFEKLGIIDKRALVEIIYFEQ